MDTKFLSYTGLQEYDDLIKSYVDTGLGKKAPSTHTHDDRYYTESEIDTKLSAINTSVDKIASGETVVSKATSATYASTATNAATASYAQTATSATNASTANFAKKATNADTATYATNAGTATYATKAGTADSATNASTATYATNAGVSSKLGTSTVGSGTQPIYLNAGVATTCSTYAGGTKLTVNGSNKGGSSAAIFAPTTGGTSGYILKSAGTGSAPVWAELDAYTKAEVDTALSNKSASTHNHDDKYDAKGASTAALADAKTYTNTKTTGMATTAVVDSKISTHNSSTAAHSDIRTAIAEVKSDVDAFFKDATISAEAKDTLKEIQEYITSDVAAAAAMTASINNKAEKSDLTAHTGSTAVHITDAERTAWNTAASNAQKNQNAFSNVKVGSTTVAADTTTDTIEFVGSNVTITPDATNDKITFTVANGTTAAKGLVQLTDSVASTATTTAATPNSVKQAYDLANSAKIAADAAQATADGKAASTHVHAIADVSGLQTALDGKAASSHGTHVTWSTTSPKMDGTASVGSETKVARGDHVHPTDTSRASKTEFDTHVASTVSHITSTERTTWNAKASTASATTATAGLMTAADKTKLDGIATGANKITVDTALSSTSTNPVQNKAVNSAIATLTSAVTTNTNSISTLTSAIGAIEEISSSEIAALFA